MNHFKSLLLLGSILMVSFLGKATVLPITKATLHTVGSTPVPVGATMTVAAPADGSYTYSDVTKKGLITFGVDHKFPTIVSEAHTTVELKITTYNTVGGGANTPFNVTLELDYKPNTQLSFNDRQIYELNGILKYTVEVYKINGVASGNLPDNLYIDAEMFVDRVYSFSSWLNATVDLEHPDESKILDGDCDEVEDKLLVRWDKITEADEYQVEWTYVNDYTAESGTYKNATDVSYDFRFNSTRISTAKNEYEIPLTYDHGYVVYRVRAVGRYMADPTKRQYSLWSIPQSGDVNPDADGHYHFISNAWEASKNWQYSVTFAEEGKRKEVVSFFDGSLRNRQMVTLISTNEKAIVGETIYDHQGRPAVQVLPVPVPEPEECASGDNSLKYYRDFNKNSVSEPIAYNRSHFDITTTGCSIDAQGMSTSSGASKYYSSFNTEVTNAQAYVPEANGYPFSQVEYTPDNTGRIRRQGGVGEEFQLNSNHETKYFYGHPSQIELDRLFGSEVGYAKHYQKNMVIDANGQASVSYLDQEGRVIATSLAGNAPSNVIALESLSGAQVSLTDYILYSGDQSSNELSTDGMSTTVTETILISSVTDLDINYQIVPEVFADECLAGEICFGCTYDLIIDLKDECGESILPNDVLDTVTGSFTYGGIYGDSMIFSMACDFDGGVNPITNLHLDDVAVGSYQLSKTLRINEDALAYYQQQYMNPEVNECFKTLEDFQQEYLEAADYSGCEPDTTCAQCLADLPTESAFVSGGYGTAADYQVLVDNCKALCEPVSMYESYRDFLLMDMNPGGQYGEYLVSNGTVQPGNYPLSVYNTNNKLPRSYVSSPLTVPDWQAPVCVLNGTTTNKYYDQNLSTESKVYVTVTLSGTTIIGSSPEVVSFGGITADGNGLYYTTAQNLAHVEDFIEAFQPSWAYSLIYYHPEYNILKTYSELAEKDTNDVSSETFDALMNDADTWAQAITSKLIKSNYNTFTNVNARIEPYDTISVVHAYDPFITAMAGDTVLWTQFKNALKAKLRTNYNQVNSTNRPLAEYAAMVSGCGEQIGTTSFASDCFGFGYNATGSSSGGTSAADIAARDEDWRAFKSFYRGLKQQYIAQLAIQRSIKNSGYTGYNGCIGNSNFNPFAGGFFDPGLVGIGTTQYLNDEQPCFVNNAPLYANKVKRFMLPSDVSVTGTGGGGDGVTFAQSGNALYNDAIYQQYLYTGECPLSNALATVWDELAAEDHFKSASYGLINTDTYAGFVQAYSGIITPPTVLPVMTWQATVTNDSTLNVTIVNGVPATVGTIVFRLYEDTLVVWDSITGISGIHATGTGGLGYTFTGKAEHTLNGVTTYYPLFGSTSFNILSCTFPDVCERNELGSDLFDLLNAACDSTIAPSTSYNLKGTGAPIGIPTFVTDRIAKVLSGTSTPAGTVSLSFANDTISLSAPGAKSIKIAVTAKNPGGFTSFGSIAGFTDMQITGNNTFKLFAVNSSGTQIAELTCNTKLRSGGSFTTLNVGSCGQPQPGCDGTSEMNYTQLQALLTDVFINQNTPYTLGSSTAMTDHLLAQFTGLSSTSSTIQTLVYDDGLSISPRTFVSQTLSYPLGVKTTVTVEKAVTATHIITYTTTEECEFDRIVAGDSIWTCTTDEDSIYTERSFGKVNQTSVDLGDSCSLLLTLREDNITGYGLSNITHVLSFEEIGEQDLSGNYHEFKMVVKLNNSGGTNEKTDTVYGEICIPIRPCTELVAAFNGGEPFPTTVIDDPCAEIVTNLAMAAAEDAYNEYVDSLLTDFRSRYVAHCMSTIEVFNRTYTQKEYHFTLYYYDQAGNLVKTVPPEGVEQLAITSNISSLALSIAADRQNNTQGVITNHRMATVYKYNSLNQLTAQHMPDQDDMSSWGQTLANGLDANLRTTAIQMLDESIGYLTGAVTSSNAPTGSRGYLYKTTDGGTNWTRINNLFPYDLMAVEMATSTNGFAVGKSGVALRTLDGGSTWDLLNMHSKAVVGDFVSVAVQDGTNAAFLMSNGHVVPYISGVIGNEYTPANPSVPSGSVTLRTGNSITYNGSSNVYSVNLEFVVGTSPDTLRFTHMALVNISTPSTSYETVNAGQWNAINFASSTFGVVGGTDGDFVFLSETGSAGTGTQYMVSSDMVNNILDIAFIDKVTGVCLANDGSNTYFYKTTDKGITWTKVSNTTASVMTVVSQTSTNIYVAVCYSDGNTKYYEITNSATTEKWSSSSGVLTEITSYQNGSNYFVVGTVGLDIKKSAAFVQVPSSTPAFSTYYTYPNGTTPTTLKACEISGTVHVIGIRTVATLPVVTDAYKIGGAAVATVGIHPTSTNFKDLAFGSNGGTYLLAYENTNQKIHRMALSSSAPTSGSLAAISASASTLPASSAIIAMGMHGDYISLINGVGKIYSCTTAVTSSSTTNLVWLDRSDLRLAPIRSITAVSYPFSSPTHNALAVGDKGLVLKRTNANVWTVFPMALQTSANTSPMLQTVASTTVSSVRYAWVMGSNGTRIGWNLNTGATSTPSGFGGTVSVMSFTDVTLNTSGKAIVTTSAGKAFFCNDITAGTPSVSEVTTGLSSLNSASFIPSSNTAVVVGNGCVLGTVSSSTYTGNSSIFGPCLNNVHFASSSMGTVVGDNFFVRSTVNSGGLWSRVLPATLTSTTLTRKATEVWTRPTAGSAHFAVIGGTYVSAAPLLSTVYNGIATPVTLNSNYNSKNINDIKFFAGTPGSGYAAVGKELFTFTLTTSGGSYSLTPGTSATVSASDTINAMHLFDNGSLMAVGRSSTLNYRPSTGGSFVSMSTGVSGNLRDIVFTDATHGYVVGDGGVFYQTDAVSFNSYGTAYTAMSWIQKTINDAYSGTAANINVTALEFPSASKAVWGGNYVSHPGLGYAAVRVLAVENQSYSARFYYDRLGRIVVSQNSRQKGVNKYSYTLYDVLGRVYEAGEKTENSSGAQFASIFGTNVGGQYVTSVIDDTKLSTWVTTSGTTTRKEVTRSYYDGVNTSINGNGLSSNYTFNTGTQRKRIVHVTYEATFDNSDATYDHATHYDYDIHGNVKTLLQDNKTLGALTDLSAQRFKRMDYVYDLISGNVHRVDYQTGKADQWHHAYEYDADNRITDVYTTATTPLTDASRGVIGVMAEPEASPYWTREAQYEYYDHGPLARTVLGDHEVQGLDYAYTLQGWIKAVNSNDLRDDHDPGGDGNSLSPNHYVGMDAMGYSLHYFTSDYSPIVNANIDLVAAQTSSDLTANSYDLYNGNIGRMVTTITDPDTRAILPLGNAYKYDQLHRLKQAVSFTNLSSNAWGSGQAAMYGNYFTYDANGNILTQLRKNHAGTNIDSLSYKYHRQSDNKMLQNRLYHVDDQVSSGTYSDDIDDMGTFSNAGNINTANNYVYDAEGRLVKDVQEQIASIDWRVDGKVKKINRTGGSSKKNVSFDYDAMGHRIAKHVYTSANVLEKSTYYILDAQGNVMSTYDRDINSGGATITYKQKEQHIYGSSRLGVKNRLLPLLGSQNSTYSQALVKDTIGMKNYELSNHLGNVLSVISDKPIPHNNGSGTLDYVLADIRQSSDYSPFGVELSNRNLLKTGVSNDFRYGYQGSEADDEMKGDGNSYTTEYRFLDPRLGRWLSIDPMASKLPWQSPYCSMDNNPILLNDPLGDFSGDKEAKKLEKEAKNLVKRAEKIKKASDKLSSKEKNQATKCVRKHGGHVLEWEDKGFKRYNVVNSYFVSEGAGSDDLGYLVVRPETFFNKKQWDKLKSDKVELKKDVKKWERGMVKLTEKIVQMCDGIHDAYGISVGGDAFVVGGGGLNVGVVFITRGKDFGPHLTFTTAQGGGVGYGGGVSIYQGDHAGDENKMLEDMRGTGYQITGKFLVGASVSASFDKNGNPTWYGGSASIGPVAGGSFQKTTTYIDGE